MKPGYKVKSILEAQGRAWNVEEVQAWLALWVDTTIQRQLLGVVRNTAISTRSHRKWQERATSAVQNSIGEKLKELMKKYKKVVDGLCRSGAGVDSENECVEGIF